MEMVVDVWLARHGGIGRTLALVDSAAKITSVDVGLMDCL